VTVSVRVSVCVRACVWVCMCLICFALLCWSSVSAGRVAGQRVVNLDTLEHEEYEPGRYLDNFNDIIVIAFGGVQITRQFLMMVCIQTITMALYFTICYSHQ
jgi:hypothetical protein